MVKYTTPAIQLRIKGIDLTAEQDVRVTLSEDGGVKLTKSGADLNITAEEEQGVIVTTIALVLSQQESAAFNYVSEVQVNWINSQGKRDATEIKTLSVSENLLAEVISYGG